MKVLFALALVCAVALVQANQTIDDFTVNQTPLSVNIDSTSASTVATSAQNLFGGERDTSLDLSVGSSCPTGITATSYVNVNGFLDANGDGVNDNPSDLGIFVAANDQSCFAKSVINYGGVGNAGLTGADRNFNNIGTALHIRYYSDLANRQVVLRVVSGANSCTATVTTTGSQILDDKTVPFSAFSAGCNFASVDRLQIEIPAQSNLDVTLFLFEFVGSSLSGRVYIDCACDNTFNNNDIPQVGVTVTATPGSNCGGAATVTTTTAGDGTYRFPSLNACTYTISSIVSGATPCTGSSRTGTTTFGTETTGIDFPYRGSSSFNVPDDIEVLCTQSTDPSQTGSATGSSVCDSRTITYQDTPTAGTCDAKGTISRRWTDGTNSGTQTITISDTGVGPSLTCPADTVVACDSSLLPSVTGRPTVGDDCSNDIDVFYTGTDADAQCDGNTCTRNKIVTRVFRAVDDCGNDGPSTCTQTITITPCASAKTCPTPPNCHNGSIFYRNNVAQN